ncbi:hypothetical protein OG244_13770 [Streptomyces brevispora]|uniref:hypothetical protein n=1 Tax=Streptomyces brevispora TaxID=887462 RepID=UPI002E2F0F50|nr:hypothetical protein [Streptomyces brevispora]
MGTSSVRPPLIGSLCSGYGGLDLGVQSVLGGSLAWHAEVDPGASRILARHWPGVPNLGDIAAVDWSNVPANAASGNRAVGPPFSARTACSPQDPRSVEDLTGALSLQHAPSTATRLAGTDGTAVRIREALSRPAGHESGHSCRSTPGGFAVIRPTVQSMQRDAPLCSDGWKSLPDVASDVI